MTVIVIFGVVVAGLLALALATLIDDSPNP